MGPKTVKKRKYLAMRKWPARIPLVEDKSKSRIPTTEEEQEILNDLLIEAIEKEFIKGIKFLLELGADVNYQLKKERKDMYIGRAHVWFSKGSTLLMAVSAGGLTDICKLLVEYGADVNIQDEGGGTAIWNGAWNGHAETVEYLLSVGANPLFLKGTYHEHWELETKEIIKKYTEKWEKIGVERANSMLLSARNCEPEKMHSIFINL